MKLQPNKLKFTAVLLSQKKRVLEIEAHIRKAWRGCKKVMTLWGCRCQRLIPGIPQTNELTNKTIIYDKLNSKSHQGL